jgi:phosphoglycerate dehydrogenase-like enzyme
MAAAQFRLMKATVFLINTARGGIVDTQALCEALRERRIAGGLGRLRG